MSDQAHAHVDEAFANAVLIALAVGVVAALGVTGASATGSKIFNVTNLVSDGPITAVVTDAALVNGWGLSAGPTTPWWVSDNGTNSTTLYNGAGAKVALTVAVPGGPTGTVFNGAATDFVITQNGKTGAARFLFATESGMILGWSPTVNGTNAVTAVDRSAQGAVYDGLATLNDRLYAADFHNARVDVFDGNFGLVATPGAFVDPKLPAGFAPFGITNIDGQIFVSYGKQDAEQSDELAGQGLGFVDRFKTNGAFIGRVVTRGQLNAPWGLARAPAGFRPFGGDLLVGNFGDGEINAYEPQPDGTYERVGALRGENHKPILIDGLWALAFGKGALANNGPTDTLFFTAGPDDEQHGLFGRIRAG